jgi:non-lysosomal glucosylceramidase
MAYEVTTRRESKARSGTALGGIGAGSFELRQDGTFRNWAIFNNRPLGTGEPLQMPEDTMLFFVVRYQVEGGEPRMKILQVDEGYKVGAIECHHYAFPWMTGVDRIDYSATFPFARLTFTDADMPFVVEMEAFSPFIPHDVKDSSLPAAVFDFTVTSRSRRPVDVMLMASMHNAVGYDVRDKHHVTKVLRRKGCKVFAVTEGGMDEAHSSNGSQALVSLAPDTTHYVGWEVEHPYYEVVIRSSTLPNTDDTGGRNTLDPETGRLWANCRLFGTLGVSRRLASRRSFRHTFVTTWCFPNLYASRGKHVEGHYYSNFFGSAPEVATYVVRRLGDLRDRTRRFTRDFYDSSAPGFVLDQVNSHLNTFFTSTWLTREMKFGVLEGLLPHGSRGPLATMDVSTYGAMSVAALFPQLHQSMMRAHRALQFPSGEVCHGINKDFGEFDRHEGVTSRLDLPSQYVLLTLLGYFWTGDRAYLADMWPSVKKAIEYVLEHRDANGDCLPDMGGAMCTYDNFAMYGAASYVSSLWLGALKAAVAVARVLGDGEAAERYAGILEAGGQAFEEKLWTGSYYRLFNDAGGPNGTVDDGCLTDQIIGQWLCRLAGLGDIVPRGHVKKALRTICGMSRQSWGLVNCRWPDDEFLHEVPPECWHDQANSCWTGVELAFASFLLYEEMYRQALGVVGNVDARYRKVGMYWDHIEFGGHYYRPMSAWAVINGLLGLTINDGAYGFAPRVPGDDVRLFFSFGSGTAHYERRVSARSERHAVLVRTGELTCRELRFALRRRGASHVAVRAGGRSVPRGQWEAGISEGELLLAFPRGLTVGEGDALRVTVR